MARYCGPRSKISRKYGVALFGPDKVLEKRNFPPGVHGVKGRRKQSDYAVAMGEKQKLKHMYGVLERQFRRYYEIAARKRGITGETMLQMLESRLDNIVYRLGFATSRAFSRQVVTHGHVLVNGKKVNIPSYLCKAGDVIEIKNNPKSRTIASKSLDCSNLDPVPDWMTLDKESFKGSYNRIPTREEIAPIVNERMVVELYSR